MYLLNDRHFKIFSVLILFILIAGCAKENLQPSSVSESYDPDIMQLAVGDAVSITNPGFESNWSGWNDTDPSAISGDANSGSKSAKITGSGARFDQTVTVNPNTEYTLSAYVKGSWRIGAEHGGQRNTRSGNASDWKKESVTFTTGSSTSAVILGEYRSGDGRFDDFQLIEGQSTSSGNERHQTMVGKTVRIENVSSDLWARISGNGSGVAVKLTTSASTGTWPRWVVEEVNDGGDYYYRFKNVSSNKRFRPEGSGAQDIEVGNTNSTGTWTQWEITSDGNGNYVFKNRAHGTYLNAGNNSNGSTVEASTGQSGDLTTWRIEDLNGDDANGEGTSNGGSPAGVMGISENDWKLNVFSGSLSDPDYLDAAPDLDNYSNANWFYTEGNFAMFKCYSSYPGNNGDNENPRVELREMNGSNLASWNGSNNTLHRMVWSVKIDRLPSSGKLCYGQIHADGGLLDSRGIKFDDLIRVQVGNGSNDADRTSGSAPIKINGWVTEKNGDGNSDNVGTYTMGTTMNLELTMQNDVIRLFRNGSQIYIYDGTGNNSVPANSTGNYFKAGNYLQSVSQINNFDANDYGVVGISNLDIF